MGEATRQLINARRSLTSVCSWRCMLRIESHCSVVIVDSEVVVTTS
jgi:hypothetical protein